MILVFIIFPFFSPQGRLVRFGFPHLGQPLANGGKRAIHHGPFLLRQGGACFPDDPVDLLHDSPAGRLSLLRQPEGRSITLSGAAVADQIAFLFQKIQ